MEYKKNAEEVKISEEYKKTVEEYHKPVKEYFSTAEEYHKPVKEYFIEESAKESAHGIKKEKSVSFMKKVRKMGYLVAASVAVVTLSQTIDPVISYNDEEQIENNKNDMMHVGDISIDVPGLDGYEDDDVSDTIVEDAENLTSEYLDLTLYDNCSTANGGVFLVEENGLWGLMSFSGKMLCEPKYNGNNWCAPNDDGYSVVDNNGIYYVLDNRGKEVFVWTEGADEFHITDNNIICIEQVNYDEDEQRVFYYKVDGTEIYSMGDMLAVVFLASPFHEGIGMVCCDEISYMVFENGTIQEVKYTDTPPYIRASSPYSGGYFFGYEVENGFWLVDTKSGKGMNVGWETDIIKKYAPEFEHEEAWFDGYYEDGQYLYNYQTYCCVSATSGDESVSVLLDARDLSKAIAVYDNIRMDNFKYLRVIHEGSYFFMDWSGNIISDIYKAATAFNEDGYAMIIKESGTAHLINSSFEILDTIENVTVIGNSGDAFSMEWKGEEVLYVPAYEIGR